MKTSRYSPRLSCGSWPVRNVFPTEGESEAVVIGRALVRLAEAPLLKETTTPAPAADAEMAKAA